MHVQPPTCPTCGMHWFFLILQIPDDYVSRNAVGTAHIGSDNKTREAAAGRAIRGQQDNVQECRVNGLGAQSQSVAQTDDRNTAGGDSDHITLHVDHDRRRENNSTQDEAKDCGRQQEILDIDADNGYGVELKGVTQTDARNTDGDHVALHGGKRSDEKSTSADSCDKF